MVLIKVLINIVEFMLFHLAPEKYVATIINLYTCLTDVLGNLQMLVIILCCSTHYVVSIVLSRSHFRD